MGSVDVLGGGEFAGDGGNDRAETIAESDKEFEGGEAELGEAPGDIRFDSPP